MNRNTTSTLKSALGAILCGEIASYETKDRFRRNTWHSLVSTPEGNRWLQQFSQKHEFIALADQVHSRIRLYGTGDVSDAKLQAIMDLLGRKVSYKSSRICLLQRFALLQAVRASQNLHAR
ncbi:hypothetical protein P171DRAFT_428292 [Karstenula rhodostoma CBS 690.94]|uniref:Uncharacterized protein n=1 Tax=Karstenula rhodostoma CBS 690.94 TaxID=1392251 RepID=A0A9P4PSS7_9PLEO|nr:hypothetical protein P171DRAFT_428292 [Karstenula rhodostoma CBS 690.94]